MVYSNIKSSYIKNLLTNTSWDEHKIVDDLIQLHAYIITPPKNYNGGMHLNHLKNMYETEFLILLKEHSEIAYEAEIKKRKAYNDRLIEDAEKQSKQIEKLRLEWLKAGGKP